MAKKNTEKSKKGNKHATNLNRRKRKASLYLSNLRSRMNPADPKWRSKNDEAKATRLYLGNENVNRTF